MILILLIGNALSFGAAMFVEFGLWDLIWQALQP